MNTTVPCDVTTLIKFRQLLGEEGAEELLAQTINVAIGVDLDNPDVHIVHRADQWAGEKAAQAAPGHQTHHRPPQSQSPHGPLSPQR